MSVCLCFAAFADRIGVIDTGVNLLEITVENRSKLVSSLNGDLLSKGRTVTDELGHGTRVMESLLKSCEKCSAFALRVASQSRPSPDADLYAAAIDQGVKRGAKILVIASGTTRTSPRLKSAIEKAERLGVLVLAAAGVGVPNPFRPIALSTLYPQSFATVLVVGNSLQGGKPDPLANFGPELAVTIEEPQGSSQAVAKVAGQIADLWRANPRWSVSQLRERVRGGTLSKK